MSSTERISRGDCIGEMSRKPRGATRSAGSNKGMHRSARRELHNNGELPRAR